MHCKIFPVSKFIKALMMAHTGETCSHESTDNSSAVCDCFSTYTSDNALSLRRQGAYSCVMFQESVAHAKPCP